MITDQEFWESRYRNREYIYGKVANRFFREQIRSNPPGKILCLCEGEGRNAVYAAYSGWEVVATDFSERAREKAMELAGSKNVKLEYHVCDVFDFHFQENEYDYIALIFCHFSPEQREEIFPKIIKSLKPGGTIIFEGFSTEQLGRKSGGPSDPEKLYTLEMLHDLFPDFDFRKIEQTESRMNEGFYHVGMANVIHFTAIKRF